MHQSFSFYRLYLRQFVRLVRMRNLQLNHHRRQRRQLFRLQRWRVPGKPNPPPNGRCPPNAEGRLQMPLRWWRSLRASISVFLLQTLQARERLSFATLATNHSRSTWFSLRASARPRPTLLESRFRLAEPSSFRSSLKGLRRWEFVDHRSR